LTLDEVAVIERHIHQLDEDLAELLRGHQDAVERLAAVPGLGVDSAHQIITAVGPTAATFASAKRLASWVGACPGHDERAGINHSHRAQRRTAKMIRELRALGYRVDPVSAPASSPA
jgi:transposase